MRKQLFYLTNNQLTAAIWRNGGIAVADVFDNDEAGWHAFGEHLAGHRNVPAYLLIDFIEEDFQRDTIPHVLGRARAALIERRLAGIYRETPFRQASLQGRDKEGRKDDRVLFSAITNPDLLKPWVERILAEKVPLAGIYSTALLTSLLFKKLKLPAKPALIVTHQSSGLRQSYFHEGFFRFSRLTPLNTDDPDEIAKVIDLEMGKTRQFLASTRLLPRGEQIAVTVLTDAAIQQALLPLCADTPSAQYHLIDLHEAAALMGLGHPGDARTCDIVMLSMLANKYVSSHYSFFEQTRFYAIWQTRIALYALSAACVLAGFGLSAANIFRTFDVLKQTQQLGADTQATNVQYQKIIASMPVTVANPHDMKTAVDMEYTMAQNVPVPRDIMGVLGEVLGGLPQIKIHKLNWQASETDGAATDQAAPAPVQSSDKPEPPLPSVIVGLPKKPVEILSIEGEVAPFQNDYRLALESVNKLSNALSAKGKLQVEIVRSPLDTRPVAKLEGQAGADDTHPKALFELKLIRKP